VDLFASEEIPRLLELDCGSHQTLAAFNWGEEPARVDAPLPEGRIRIFDAWSREDLGENRGLFTLDVPAHGCRLLAVRDVESRAESIGRQLPRLFRRPDR
jgi:hypothetical protein